MIDTGADLATLPTIIDTSPEFFLMAAALLIGKMVKQSSLDDSTIPAIVVAMTGVVGFIILQQDWNSFIIGVKCGLYTVATHQSFKQIGKQVKKKKKVKRAKKDDSSDSPS